jgi:hypothetical protein
MRKGLLPRTIASLLLCLLLTAVAIAPAQASGWRVDGVDRVVAISDVHGAYDAMVETLRNVGILDDGLAWTGGTSHLVIVGDILDRGPRSRDAMDLLMRLEDEAQAAGGYVHVLIGNHESMNMIGDMRYVSKGEYAAFAADEAPEQRDRWFDAYVRRQPEDSDVVALREHFDATFPAGFFALRKALGPSGKYGKWLLSKPVIAVINGTAFVHGGLSPAVDKYGLDGVNQTLQNELARYVQAAQVLMKAEILLPTDSQFDYVKIVNRHMPSAGDTPEVRAALETVQRLDAESLISTDGPLWYRANVACSGIIEKHRLEASLAAIGADRVVVGHTPTPGRRVLQRFGGRLIEVDTGMLNFYYKGSGNALVMAGDEVLIYNQAGGDPYDPLPHPRDVGIRPFNMTAEELEALLRDGDVVATTTEMDTDRTIVEISANDRAVRALFTRRKSKGFYPDVAAYRIDRMLELDMVPVAVQREVDGRDGTVQFLPTKTMDEGGRAAEGRGYGATCPLSDQHMAMYVFDTLIFNEGRTRERMLYDLRDWGLMLIEHDGAFGTRKGRPRHLANAPLAFSDGWVTALRELTDDALTANLADVLPSKRIRALADRRDEVLAQKSASDRR